MAQPDWTRLDPSLHTGAAQHQPPRSTCARTAREFGASSQTGSPRASGKFGQVQAVHIAGQLAILPLPLDGIRPSIRRHSQGDERTRQRRIHSYASSIVQCSQNDDPSPDDTLQHSTVTITILTTTTNHQGPAYIPRLYLPALSESHQ